MKRSLLSLFALLLFSTVAPAATGDGPAWAASFEQACRDAESSHKIVLVDVYTTWCAPCHALDERTWPDAAVRTWMAEKVVPVKVDAEKLVDLAAKYGIKAYPTILLLKPDGTEIDRIVGFREPAELVSAATDALAGRDAVTRAKEKLAAAGEYDTEARMDYARALSEKGRNEEALAEYLWCFDHGLEHEPAFSGVRLSFLLSYVAELGESYPPALDALRTRRDAAEKAVLGGSRSFQSAMDFASLDRYLGDTARTLAAYDAMKTKSPEARELLFRDVLDDLLAARRYADVADGAGDLSKGVESRIADFDAFRKAIAGDPTAREHEAIIKSHAVREGAKYYEALVGLGRLDEASKAADRLIAFSSTGATYAALVRAATHAGKPDVAKALVARGLANLPEADRAPLQQAAGEIAGAPKK